MNLIALGAALSVTAIIWYPDWVWPAYAVGIPLALWGIWREVHRAQQAKPGWVRARPRGRSRWLPGFGLGIGFWPHIHPTLWLGLWRFRR